MNRALTDGSAQAARAPQVAAALRAYLAYRAADTALILRDLAGGVALAALQGLNQFPAPIWTAAGVRRVRFDRPTGPREMARPPLAAPAVPSRTSAVKSSAASKPGGASPPGKKACPSPDGCKGKPDHQRAVRDLVEQAEREFPDRDRYEIRSNKSIEPQSGLRRRPDVAVIDTATNRVVKVYEAARANKDGVTPVARERKKVEEYDSKSIPSQVKIVR